MSSIGIGALAKHAGVRIDTVRYNERSGLATLVAACPGHGRAADYPILNALGGEASP